MNGTWASTNYKDCENNLIKTAHPMNCKSKKTNFSEYNSTENENECDGTAENNDSFLRFLVFANFFGFSIAIIPLSVALFIFLSIR